MLTQLPNQKSKIKNQKSRTLVFSIILLSLILGLKSASVVLAQETSRNYTITPPSINQKLNPGQSTSGVLKVINDTEGDLNFTVGAQDFIVQDNQGTPVLVANNSLSNKFSAASWIKVTPSSFVVKPHQRQEMNYTINIPKNARPGGHYAVVTYAPTQGISVSGTGALVKTQAGTLFYISVNGPITEKSIISKFFTNSFYEYGPIKILTQIKNLGDLHITPNATVTVSGLFFNKSKALETRNIFPEVARDFETTLGQTFMIGRYKASLMGSYGVNNNMPLIASVYFWVFPWRLALVVTLAIVALILAVLYLKKRKKEGPKEPKKAETSTPIATATPTSEPTPGATSK